ncbi:Acetyl-CoA hydrolase N-acetyltransferase GNAT family fusion protein [Seminavis robusta]|uniref:Acetyl-CoA hydrolase N-acetyltransferase GNAT family fusion protein n=1 Tax=Seminavis robusta TaxID=568900 RepID=A0A9N8F2B6_9STRA|nr:Acetyl-CoA hydrolase N-acetyltransferase GNAT family fusion protein [Seminavis robusta]|eukprot:Sro2808_g337570.1 Acetyl-CoA hydrolase N-acetyltransferase GNAT family fusion protein (695) ;mRNA; f:2526-4610
MTPVSVHTTTNRNHNHKDSAISHWADKEIVADDVPSKIPNGSSIYIGSCASTPESVLMALTESSHTRDLQIIQMLPGGNLPHLNESIDKFRTSSFFSMSKTVYKSKEELQTFMSAAHEGLADYRPMSLSSVPRLLEENILQVDVCVIKVTKPHKGFVSLGMGVEHTMSFIRHAKIVIAEVTRHMPWTEGHSKLRLEQIDWWLCIDNDDNQEDGKETTLSLKTTQELWPAYFDILRSKKVSDGVLHNLGEQVIQLIPDGATLKIGWNPLCSCVYPFMYQRKDMGLHTDLFQEELFKLQKAGVINNSKKNVDRGYTVVSQAHGSAELYEFLDRNPAIEFQPTSYISDPQILAKIENLVVLEAALKVDLTGQVATDSIAHKFYGGVWSTDHSIRGASFSPGGKPIIMLLSKSSQGRSNILLELPLGSGVTITRMDVEYVVTEYGIAYLYGKSIRERCLALIEIAHPDFRGILLEQAKQFKYLSDSQMGKSFLCHYPAHFECLHTTRKTHREVFVRPIKAVDEDLLRQFFHKLSNHSVYLRYFRKMESLPQRILQKYSDVDYSSDMALVVLHPPPSVRSSRTGSFSSELVAIGQWIADPRPGAPVKAPPEIAFQVRDDWQGEGLGKYLFRRLVELSQTFEDLTRFKADVLADNRGMRHVFESSGVPFRKHTEFGVVTYTFYLDQYQQQQQQEQTSMEE